MPLLLDLFCGAGGAAMGYHRAGFDVIGVDIEPQPDYPFEFYQDEAVGLLTDLNSGATWPKPLNDVVAIHASPPCQSYTTMTNRYGGSAQPMLIDEIRSQLDVVGLPYIIENVTGARPHMRSPLMLHGGQFGLNVWRPRLFESNVLLISPPKAPRPVEAAAIYGEDERSKVRRKVWTRTDGSALYQATLEEAREAMGMPWADWIGVKEAVPPAFTEYLGRQLLAFTTTERGTRP